MKTVVKQQGEDDGTIRSKQAHQRGLWVEAKKEDKACEARVDSKIKGVETNDGEAKDEMGLGIRVTCTYYE